MNYTVQQKAMAIEMLDRHGGLTREGIDAVRLALNAPGLSRSTLHDWRKRREHNLTRAAANDEIDITPDEALEQAALELDDAFEQIAHRYLTHAAKPKVIQDTRGKDAVMAAAIAVDKMRLIRGLPTAVVQVLPVIIDKITALGLSPADYFNAMIQELDDAAQRANTD